MGFGLGFGLFYFHNDRTLSKMGQFELLLIEIQDSERRVKCISSEKETNIHFPSE